MTTEQRVDRLEAVTEEILASLKRLEEGQKGMERQFAITQSMVNFLAVNLLPDEKVQQMADLVRALEQE